MPFSYLLWDWDLWLPCVAEVDISSPILSGRRLDVYHTSTHDVALVQTYNAGLKCVAHGLVKYRTQKLRKNAPSAHHRTILPGYIFATKACINDREKKLVKQQYLLHMSSQYGELRPTSG